MPKVHKLGTKRFFQYIDFPVEWKNKFYVRGWTQEIEEPFRTATPLIVRLPNHKALVLGTWTGKQEDEEAALSAAIEGRILTDEDFQEGWTPPAYKTGDESIEDWDL